MVRIRRPFSLVTRSVPRMSVRPENTVLLVQDMQRCLVEAGHGMAAIARHRGVAAEFEDYAAQVASVTEVIAAMCGRLRPLGIAVCHTRWVGNGAAMMPLQRALDIVPAADDPAAAIVDALAPEDDGNMFDKPGLSAFSAPTLGAALAERRIENIIITGVVLELGIQATALQAMDLGYRPLIVSDGCASLTNDIHEIILDGLSFGIAKVRPWEELWYTLEGLEHDDVVLV